MQFLILFGGFVPLILGANWLVNGASALAKKLKVSDLVIGLTIVAFGTSAPELVVNLFAGNAGSSGIAVGNIIGSNIFNILFILGLSALIHPVDVHSNTVWKEIPLSLLAVVMVFVLGNDLLLTESAANILSRSDGIVLLAFFLIFMYYSFGVAKINPDEIETPTKTYSIGLSVLFIVIGMAGLVAGGKLIVDSAVKIAQQFGMSERIIGLTIIAAGTSLPELATSVVASVKKNSDIVIGNVVGSNIFNVFFILGTSATVKSLNFDAQSNFDIAVAGFASLLIFIFAFTGKGRRIGRVEGGIMVASFIGYMIFLVLYK